MDKDVHISEAVAKKRAYNKEYAREHFKGKNLYFNTSIPEDIELLEWINKQENGTQYIKDLIRKNMRQAQESQYNIMPALYNNRPAQIPIRADRFRYLTKEYSPGVDDSGWVMFHHPGHFMIYDKVTRNCVFDASYGLLREPENLRDEELVAVVFDIRVYLEGINQPIKDDGFGLFGHLIRDEL